MIKSFLNFFIEQSAHPTGLIGNRLTKIWNKVFDRMTNWGLEIVEIKEGDILLDVACGGGETLNKLAKIGTKGKVYGIDFSSEAVKSSIKRNQCLVNDGKVIITQADAAALPFLDQMFDLVTTIQTHMYWNNLKKGYEEIYRVLKENGKLLIIAEKYKVNYHMEAYKTDEDMIKLLKDIGYENIQKRESRSWIEYIAIK